MWQIPTKAILGRTSRGTQHFPQSFLASVWLAPKGSSRIALDTISDTPYSFVQPRPNWSQATKLTHDDTQRLQITLKINHDDY